MTDDQQFAVFANDLKGPLWRGFFSTLEKAKQRAKNLADSDDLQFFVFSFETNSEVARFFPPKKEV